MWEQGASAEVQTLGSGSQEEVNVRRVFFFFFTFIGLIQHKSKCTVYLEEKESVCVRARVHVVCVCILGGGVRACVLAAPS